MVFSSLGFLFIFLPIVILGYVIFPRYLKNIWLLLSSLFFYYIGAGKYIFLLLFIILISWGAGFILDKCINKKIKKLTVIISISLMIITMGYFKYFDFIIENINLFFHAQFIKKELILPIGISFFVFQAISYVVDIYRGEKCLRNPIDMALYISFFPQLIAGPIVRFKDIRCYLVEKTKLNFDDLSQGLWRFSSGLCKKVLLANNLAGLSSIVFGVQDINSHSVLYAWLGAIAFTFQIYYDFSGYSDMAIGLGKIFGYTFPENFNYPYCSSSIKEFWRRWHISLSSFFRDYVYIPLGGNRVCKTRWIINIIIVWALTGIWHGASWNYVIWGGTYGLLLISESFLFKNERTDNRFCSYKKVFKRFITILCVIILWVVFRTTSLTAAKSFILTMFGFDSIGLIGDDFRFQLLNYWLLLLISGLFSFPIVKVMNERYCKFWVYRLITSLLLIIGVIVSISFIYMGSYNPFLYFMF